MANGGWIKLYRSIQDHWIWENPIYLKWWLDLIFMANHKDKKILFDGQLITVGIGERITSEQKLSDRWGTTRTTVRKFLNLLVVDEMITVKKSRKSGTWYKVNNYADYQSYSEEKKQPTAQLTTQLTTQLTAQPTAQLTAQLTAHKQEPKEPKNLRINNNNKEQPDEKSIFHFWESNGFGLLAPKTIQDFDYWIGDFEKIGATKENAIKLIIHSLEIAVNNNARKYNYVNAILKDWEQKRFITVDQVRAGQKKTKADKNTQPETNTDYDDLDWG